MLDAWACSTGAYMSTGNGLSAVVSGFELGDEAVVPGRSTLGLSADCSANTLVWFAMLLRFRRLKCGSGGEADAAAMREVCETNFFVFVDGPRSANAAIPLSAVKASGTP